MWEKNARALNQALLQATTALRTECETTFGKTPGHDAREAWTGTRPHLVRVLAAIWR